MFSSQGSVMHCSRLGLILPPSPVPQHHIRWYNHIFKLIRGWDIIYNLIRLSWIKQGAPPHYWAAPLTQLDHLEHQHHHGTVPGQAHPPVSTQTKNFTLTLSLLRDLSYNAIEQLGPDSLPHLPNLKSLLLNNNRLVAHIYPYLETDLLLYNNKCSSQSFDSFLFFGSEILNE